MAEIVSFSFRKHIDDVLEFQHEIYETNFPGIQVDRKFLRDYRQQLRNAADSSVQALYVLEDESGSTCGFLWVCLISTLVDPRIGYLKNIYVAPELRGQGLGKRLLRFAEDWCVEQGVDKLALDASCCNERAIGLYKDVGFHTRRLRMVKELQVADNDDELARQPREGFLSDLRKRFGDTFD